MVRLAARWVTQPTASFARACEGNESEAEGAHRWIRNRHVEPEAVEEGPFSVTQERCQGRTVLLLQDTTSVTVKPHDVYKATYKKGCGSGFKAHSTLAVDAQTGEPLGLLDQARWVP